MNQRETFASRLGFVLISAGCAIGLGNVWRFPNIVGQYGGAAFVLIYLFFLAIMGLQELGAKKIMVKASSPLHKKVLERMGVAIIVQPEIDAAKQMAFKLDNPGFLDLLPIGRGVFIQEATVDDWAGKSLRDLNVRRKSNLLVAAVREKDSDKYRFVPDPDHVLQKGDSLLIIGYGDDMQKVAGKT